MPPEIIVAFCSLAGTLFGSLFGVIQSGKLTIHRIAELEKKMDKHNNLIERMTIVEQSSKSAHKRLDGITGQLKREA